ncbi:hypothetical protein [Lysobacter sp. Root690]|uniref:hypothetical protein n=1 Tax=Lysobacter sp. Root690 TaxID=1736588 RepID=UPI0006FEC069|nr:hypothetical protein [Lysobacter sp. Root690]KRB08929.1 hypothetical protein ASD86_06535 [Lysobacter sp. Root690]
MEAVLTNLLAGGSVLGVIALVGWWLAKKAVEVFTAAGEGYAKRKGENLATKEDFDELLDQLRKNTKATEQIRTEIAHQDWAAREWKALRAKKLEELLIELNSISDHLEQYRNHVMTGAALTSESDAFAKFTTLQAMYFPELQLLCSGFLVAARAAKINLQNYALKKLRINDPEGRVQHMLGEEAEITRLAKEVILRKYDIHSEIHEVTKAILGLKAAELPPEN